MSSAQNKPYSLPNSKRPADKIFLHGNIYAGVAGNAITPEYPREGAIAVLGDRILARGTDSDIIKLKGPSTVVIDLAGRFVMPGFNDAHLHLSLAGLGKLNLNLAGVSSLNEFRSRLRTYAAAAAPGEWIVGGGWDETLWPVKILPSHHDIDDISGNHPVFLERVDSHVAVVNTRALEMAGITPATKNPAGGEIVRDPSGASTGILRETARAAVTALIPQPTREKRKQALQLALADLAQWGITSAQDNSYWEDFQALEELQREGKLTARISEWLAFNDSLETLNAHRASHPATDNMLHTTMLKGFMDGSLGSHTAAMLEPYSDDPSTSGLPRYGQTQLTEMTKERVDAGFQIGFHAIGDEGVQMALQAFAAAEASTREKNVKSPDGSNDFRLRIEHAQITNPPQVAQFKKLKVIASMQPSHVLTDMNWAIDRLGKKRAEHSYAWADFLNAGVVLAFGTDYPIEPVTPFRGLYAAVTRENEAGTQAYFPEQKITIQQAIAAYTTGAAFAEFAENDKGTLEIGKLADFVVLDRDLTSIEPKQILNTKVLRTVVGGKTVYQAP